MRSILFAVFFLFTAGCTKDSAKDVLCGAGKTTASVVAVVAATELACKNIAAIQADLEKKLVDIKVCEIKEEKSLEAKSAVGDIICAPIVNSLFAGAIAQLPANWECTGGQITEDVKAKLIASCLKSL